MYIAPQHATELPITAPNNPTDEQRHKILYNSLVKAGRPEDYENIVSQVTVNTC